MHHLCSWINPTHVQPHPPVLSKKLECAPLITHQYSNSREVHLKLVTYLYLGLHQLRTCLDPTPVQPNLLLYQILE